MRQRDASRLLSELMPRIREKNEPDANQSFHLIALSSHYHHADSQNSATRHMEAQLAKLRESTSEKQALHDRVCSYLCYGSRRRAPGHGELRGGQDGISLASSNSSTSLTVKRKGVSRGVLKGHDCFKDGLSEYRRAMDHSERKMAQKLLAEEVRRRKR